MGWNSNHKPSDSVLMQLDISVMLPLISKICYAIVKTGLQMRKNNKYQSIKMPYLVTYRPKEINKNLYLSSNFLGNIFFLWHWVCPEHWHNRCSGCSGWGQCIYHVDVCMGWGSDSTVVLGVWHQQKRACTLWLSGLYDSRGQLFRR